MTPDDPLHTPAIDALVGAQGGGGVTDQVVIGGATLFLGDCRTVLPTLPAALADCCITDPPYGDTSLAWDIKCSGWIDSVAAALNPSASVWVFGSMRFLAPIFDDMRDAGFKYSQDIVWEKQNGSGFHADRFRRVHEHVVMFYRGAWRDVYHDPQTTPSARAKVVRRKTRPTHTGHIEAGHYVSEDGGPLLRRSVLQVRNEHGRAIHPTQKPVDLLIPLVQYSCPPGGTVLDCFAGSGSVGMAAEHAGRKSVLIESNAAYFDGMKKRLQDATTTQQRAA